MADLYLIPPVPWWVAASIGALAAFLLVLQYRALRERLGPRRSALLTLLRGLVYGLLVFFLLGPAWVERRVVKLRRPLALLIDSSQSMALPADAPGTPPKSRLDAVKDALLPLLERLVRDYDLRLFRFGDGLEPVTPAAVRSLGARDGRTRLVEALEAAAKEVPAQSGILVFSDGIANGERAAADGAPPLPLPVFSVTVGRPQAYTDLRIAEVRAPEFGFRGREIKLDVIVEAYGLRGRKLPLYFNRGRNLVSAQSVDIDADPFEKRISLSFTPKEIGAHHFNVSLPVQPGEQIAHNNRKEFAVDVQRDKIRVLTLSGSPAWNYRFLRMALKQDPLVDLVSFVFLRTPTDSVDVPDSQLSLIPFPIDDIFLEELKNFDVVILDDFSHRAYFNPVYLEKLRDFVRDGGGLAVFGGARAFDSGGYGESALKEVLPVELDGKGTYRGRTSVRAVLTPAGKAHPITRLVADARANEETWSRLPQLTAFNRVQRARGETLLALSGDGSDGQPLLTVGRFGQGRTLALMSDEAWRWNFIAVGNRETPQHHLKFVRQAVRWLAREPSFEQVKILPVAASRPGEKAAITVRVLKDDFTPAAQASVQLRVLGPDGDPLLVPVSPGDSPGDYRGEFTPAREGSYRVEAEAALAGRTLGRDRSAFSVAAGYHESEDGRPRPELLERISRSSRGEHFTIEQWNEKALEKIAARLEGQAPSRIVERRQTRLWSTPWIFSLALVLLAAEWWTRRKWGLV
ncbi:MAG TPA: glutamine amidotransferase [candidate division Zixibacteria bacterium]|nr:glutamine amidotransferase [candidate division Zixibacteria bacterium]